MLRIIVCSQREIAAKILLCYCEESLRFGARRSSNDEIFQEGGKGFFREP